MAIIPTMDAGQTDRLLSALGEQLAARGERVELVVIGGSGLLALGLISRPTGDVDIVALLSGGLLTKPRPLPAAVIEARDHVARDFNLPEDWLNAAPADLLDFGLPDSFVDRLERRDYGEALTVHLASRYDQIHFKLYAMVDQGAGKHEADLRDHSPPATNSSPPPAGRAHTTHRKDSASSSSPRSPTSESKMSASTLKDSVTTCLLGFAWDQWAQLGVFAPTNRRDQTAADPEALLLFTFEIGRSDPRLFDETLDWLLTNERLVSVQRLRNLCRDDDDRDLVEGALAWLGRQQPRSRPVPPRARERRATEPRPLFYDVARQVREPDEAFLTVGLLKPATEPSKKSQPPDPDTPINFAFRMRHLFGLGSRAEIVRYLVTAPVTDASALGIADAAAYAKRNINETLTSLVASRVVTTYEHGNERRYYLDRAMWGQFLRFDPAGWPTYRDWPRLLGAFRRLSRWLHDSRLDQLTPYMLASNAHTLMDELDSELALAGVPVPNMSSRAGEHYWSAFVEAIQCSLEALLPVGTS